MLKKCDGRTDKRTNEQTDLSIELRYAQLIKQIQNQHNLNKQNINLPDAAIPLNKATPVRTHLFLLIQYC